MKPRILILACLALLLFGTTALAAPMYVDTVIDYTRGTNLAATSLRTNTDNALGAPDDYGNINDPKFLSLGLGGSAEFSFGRNFTGSITVYEATYGRSGYYEYANVFGSIDGSNWTLLGAIDNQNVDADGGFTLDFTGIFSFLKIEDTTALMQGTLGDGFDIDAVKASPTPIPGAAWLLGSGLIGLVGLRRRFNA